MNKKIYLAGAMEKYGKENSNQAKEWRKEARIFFQRTSFFDCISPTDYYSFEWKLQKNESEVFRFDLHKVKESDLVLVNLKDIRSSIGTCDEIMYAYMNGVPVIGFLETPYELNEEEIIKEIHPWKYLQINRIETGKGAMIKAMNYINGFYG